MADRAVYPAHTLDAGRFMYDMAEEAAAIEALRLYLEGGSRPFWIKPAAALQAYDQAVARYAELETDLKRRLDLMRAKAGLPSTSDMPL